jgi:hypothetical protein
VLAFGVNVNTPVAPSYATEEKAGKAAGKAGVADAINPRATVIRTLSEVPKFVWVVKATVIGAAGACVILSAAATVKVTPVMMPPRAPEFTVPGLSVNKVRVS